MSIAAYLVCRSSALDYNKFMNSAVLNEPVSPQRQDNSPGNEFGYRSVSKSAVACFVFAVLGMTSWMAPVFVILPMMGAALGIVALVNFHRFPDELIGRAVAKIGLVVSLIFLVGSTGMHFYVYSTEVPDGYRRIAYSDLRPNDRTDLPFSEKALALDGKKVFLKGYVRPSTKSRKMKDFILVGDFGDCCFGTSPDITDVVAISIVSDDTVDFGYSLRRIGGVFKLNENPREVGEEGIPQVYYEIHADYIR